MKRSILAGVAMCLIFSGCAPRVVYVKRPCPKLHTLHVKPIEGLHYEVR